MVEVEFIASLSRIRWSATDSNFKIAELYVDDVLDGKIESDYTFCDYIVAKGEFNMMPDTKYIINAELINDPKWGKQYNVTLCKRANPVEDMGTEQFKKFLSQLTDRADAICEKYDDPKKIFEDHDIDALCAVKGIGETTAKSLLVLYDNERDYSLAYAEFGKYGFSQEFAKRAVYLEDSMDLAVKHLKEDPYYFMKYKGIGFKIIDDKMLNYGIKVNDPRRVHAFIFDFFETLESEGNSWVYLEDLKNYLRQQIFNVDLKDALQFIKDSDDFVTFKRSNKTCVETRKYFELEKSTGNELIRLLNSDCNFKLKNVDKIIKDVENSQGWKYSKMQRKAIDSMLENNVFLLQGLSGAGKSSTLNAVIKVFQENGIMVSSCALSGKAADNLTQITGRQGSTIHRLLAVDGNGKFHFNKKSKLSDQVIILDEVSMVNIELFHSLISAIRSGAKFIMVGDNAQLESIGVGVMTGIMESNIIPTITLTEIHRQAKASAVVTHSLDYRKGVIPNELEYTGKFKRYGENRDLGYIFVKDREDISITKKTFAIFAQAVKKYGVKDTQVLTPLTSSGSVNCMILNSLCQKLVNPFKEDVKQIEVKLNKKESYFLRVGDKVINTKNNRKTTNVTGEEIIPIYNGNTGIIEKIEIETDNGTVTSQRIIVDFDGIGTVLVEDNDIRSIQLGYCITVHKSQGSTIPCVLVALPYHYMLDSRELLYTALTRASKEAHLVTTMRGLKYTVKKTSKKARRDNVAQMIKIAKKESEENV